MIKRYKRNIGLFTEKDQETVNNLRVCVIGCGGIGTQIIESLTRFGVETITAVDKDVIDETDLNRLIHSNYKTVGLPKAQITKKYVKNISDRVNINTMTLAYNKNTGKKIIKKHDIIIDAIGDFETKKLLEEHCNELEIPLVHTYYANLVGQIAVLEPSHSLMPIIENKTNIRSNNSGKPVFTAAIIGNLAVLEMLKFILGKDDNQNILFRCNLDTHITRSIQLLDNKE